VFIRGSVFRSAYCFGAFFFASGKNANTPVPPTATVTVRVWSNSLPFCTQRGADLVRVGLVGRQLRRGELPLGPGLLRLDKPLNHSSASPVGSMISSDAVVVAAAWAAPLPAGSRRFGPRIQRGVAGW